MDILAKIGGKFFETSCVFPFLSSYRIFANRKIFVPSSFEWRTACVRKRVRVSGHTLRIYLHIVERVVFFFHAGISHFSSSSGGKLGLVSNR